MANLFSKMSKVANYSAAEFIYIIELQAAAKQGIYPGTEEAREATFQILKNQYGFECYNSYEDLVEVNRQAKISQKFQQELLESQIKWIVDRGFGYLLN